MEKSIVISIATLGVVYGDIGTSPLYAIKEINNHLGAGGRNPANVLGYISLVIWTLIIIITIKYIILVLRADNEGEGGVFALFALLSRLKIKKIVFASFLLLLSVGFLLGDGMITPAISVISAIEGLGIITTAFSSFIVPITVGILLMLFLIQKKGTAKIGIIFGPIIAIWFFSLTLLGITQIINQPEIFLALSPVPAIRFILNNDFRLLLLVLGSVILVITGGEALYADMGHFGKNSIRLSWFGLVFPALVINYLGQGAFLLSNQPLINHNIFYSMVPAWGLMPMVILATLATIIASQALITGAFSLITQGIHLGYLPHLKVIHTHQEHAGQIYVPFVNLSLLAGCIFLVIMFQTSSNLASAYGLAVAYVMFVTTLSILLVARHLWQWSLLKTLLVFSPLLLIDFSLLISNSFKFFSGGYIPLIIGVSILLIMKIWHWGKQITHSKYHKYSSVTMKQLIDFKQHSVVQIPKSFIVMTPYGPKKLNHKIVLLEQILLDRYGLIPKHLTFVTVVVHKVPYYQNNRFKIIRFYDHPEKGSITSIRINYGFMENPRVERELLKLADRSDIHIDQDKKQWLVHVSTMRFFISPETKFLPKLKLCLYQLMYKNSQSADQYFDLGKDTKLSVEVLPVKLIRS